MTAEPVFKSLPYLPEGYPSNRRERLAEWWFWSSLHTVFAAFLGVAAGLAIGFPLWWALEWLLW